MSDIVNQCNGGTAVPIGHACYTAEADINRDGVIDYVSSSSDYALAGARSSTLAPGQISAASVHNIFGWNGAVFDAEGGSNGLYLMRMRHYSPVRQRWLQRDPAGYMDSANLYGYVAGNPIGWSDPFGLQQIGQAGEFVGSDPVQFGSSGGLSRFNDIARSGLGAISPQDRLDPWFDLAYHALALSDMIPHRMSREEYEIMKRGEWLDTIQYLLDLGGQVPFAGEFLDVINAGIYFGRGQYINASISLAGAIPIVGNVATGTRRTLREISGAGSQLMQTGARMRHIKLTQLDAWEQAEKMYDAWRKNDDDILAIVRNTGLPVHYVTRVKNHLMRDLHMLDEGIGRFDADPAIANAWLRLINGTHTTDDLRLLEHERFESWFESIFGTPYRRAHRAAEDSGRPGLE